MSCTGCKVSIAVMSSWAGLPVGVVHPYDSRVKVTFTPSASGGDGSCEPISPASTECQMATPCVFSGTVEMEYSSLLNGARVDMVLTTLGGSARAESKHGYAMVTGQPTGSATVKLPIGTQVGGPNTSDCEGLVNPILTASNGYHIRVWLDLPAMPRLPRDANGKPSGAEADAWPGWQGFLYCSPCEDVNVVLDRGLSNPTGVPFEPTGLVGPV